MLKQGDWSRQSGLPRRSVRAEGLDERMAAYALLLPERGATRDLRSMPAQVRDRLYARMFPQTLHDNPPTEDRQTLVRQETIENVDIHPIS